MIPSCDDIAKQMGERFSCSPHDEAVRVRTPLLYPDGDVIDVFIVHEGSGLTVTDYGETLRWLRMQTPSSSRSPRQRRLIADVCTNHGVELFRGMLSARSAPDRVGDAVLRVGQAALRVADLWFTFRTRAIQSITDDVADFLGEKEIPFERSEPIPGRSGRIWTPDFHTRAPTRSALMFVLASGSRAAARGVSEHVVACWYDLSYLRLGAQAVGFVSLFDDTADVWADEDFKLVESLSDIARWSRPDELEHVLRDAA